ncbi:uncharacterized protein CDAR_410421 [Caerostris darwini]|uniref:Uncharacterized protein n=1 Tax=Caerostris darwini TaxID=1538125 RepID=A0AAV4MX17_9ARAC|nr:uncharacterized protein CDAR_410421 [Caerostris darwini]
MHGPSLGSISNSGHLGYNGKQNHYPRSHHAATISSSYHHNSRNDPKPMKSSGIKHSYPESSSSGYYGSRHPSRHYGSSSGILSTEISGRKPQIDSAGYNSPKGYPIPKISQEKHHYDDHSLSGGIKQTSYHGMDKGLPTYPKSYPIPSKPHYQAQHLSKPSYGISKGGHSTHSHHQLKITQEKHIDDGYHGIGEVSPSYPKSYPIPSKPHYQAQHHPKPSYDIAKSGHSTHSHRQHKITQEKHIDDGYSSNGQTGYHGIGEVPPSYPKSYPIPNKPYYQAQNHPKPSYGTISKGSTHNYPQLKISQEKQIDDDHSTYQGIGQSNYHGGDLPSYPKHHPDPIKPHYQPEHHSNRVNGGIGQSGYHGIGEKSTPPHGSHTVPQKPHYQVEQPSKPVYESIKGGHHATKHTPDYHGIVESHPKSTYDHSHGSSKSLAPTPSKSYKEISGIKGGPSLEDPGHGGKKYLPITSSHNDGYKSGPSGSPIHQHSSSGSSKNYETPKIEQKDEEYGAVLGGHGSQSPAGISGGYGHSSSGSPGSSSHDVYGSDDHYEMSKPMPYEFKYEVKDDEHGADHYRQEKMDDNGYLTGRYGYKDAHGLYRQVEYEASKDGFKVSSIKTNEPGTDNEDPADVHFEVEKNSQPHY